MSLVTLNETDSNVSSVLNVVVSFSVKLGIQLLHRDRELMSVAAHARLTRSLLPGRPKDSVNVKRRQLHLHCKRSPMSPLRWVRCEFISAVYIP